MGGRAVGGGGSRTSYGVGGRRRCGPVCDLPRQDAPHDRQSKARNAGRLIGDSRNRRCEGGALWPPAAGGGKWRVKQHSAISLFLTHTSRSIPPYLPLQREEPHLGPVK